MKSRARLRKNETKMTTKLALRRAMAGAAVLLLALLGGAGAASAHDSVVGTSPSNGSTVAAMPEKVQVTMSEAPAAIGSVIQVLDSKGTNWADGGVDILDRVATQKIKLGAPAGDYTVKWRLVSSDSHPVENEFTFMALAASGGSGAVAGPVDPSQQVKTPSPEPVQETGGVPWSVFGLVAVLVAVVVAMLVIARRRLGSQG